MSNLVKHGADPEVKDKDGLTPIDVLCNTFGLPRPQRPKVFSGFDVLKGSSSKAFIEDYDDIGTPSSSSSSSSSSKSKDRALQQGIPELYSWGDGTMFQLGHGTQDNKPKPRKIRTLSGMSISAVSASKTHVLALTSAGKAYSWGSGGGGGKLGFGSDASTLTLPEPLSESSFGGRRIIAVTAGNMYSGFATDSGHVYICGGGSSGALTPKRLTVQKEDARFGQISMGDAHMVALSTTGRAYSWNGDLSTAKGATLCPVPGIESVKMAMVCAGTAHAAAVSTGGKLYVWNYGRNGAGKAVQVQVTEDRDLPEEGFTMAPCRRKGRPQKAVSVVHATAEGNVTVAVSASGKIYVVDIADKDPIQIPFGMKSAKEAWLNAAGLYAVTRTGALNFIPREPIDTFLRATRNSDVDEDYWVVYGVHAEKEVPYPTTLLYQVGVFAAGPSSMFATVPAPAPIDFDGTVHSTFTESMQTIMTSGLYSDITLCTADESVIMPAHRLFMSRCSDFEDLESGARVVTTASTETELRDLMLLVYTNTCLNPEKTKKIAEAHGFCADLSVNEHLKQMRYAKRYSDVTLSCPGMKDGSFPVHKVVLWARSEYFSAMLESGMIESKTPVIEIHELAPNVLGYLLNYLYTDSLGFGNAKLSAKLDVLVAADEFLVPSMCDAAIRDISSDIGADTVVEIAEVASGYRFHRLQDLCTRFLVTNPISLVCTSIMFELDGLIRDEVLAVSYQKAMAAEQISKKAYYKIEVAPPSSAKISPSELVDNKTVNKKSNGADDDDDDDDDDNNGNDDDDDDDDNSGNTKKGNKTTKTEIIEIGSGKKKLNSRQRKQLQKRLEQEKREREEAESKKESGELTFWDEVGGPQPQPQPQPQPSSQTKSQPQPLSSSISGVEDEPTNAKIKIIRPHSKNVKHVQFGTDDALEFIDPQEAEKKKKKMQAQKQQSPWKTLPKIDTTVPLIIPTKKQTTQPVTPVKKQVSQPSVTTKKQTTQKSRPPPPNEDGLYQPGGFQFSLADAIENSTKGSKPSKKHQPQPQPQQKKQQQQSAWGNLTKKTQTTKGSESFKSLEEIQKEELAKSRGRPSGSSWGSVASGSRDVKSLDEIMNAELKRNKKK